MDDVGWLLKSMIFVLGIITTQLSGLRERVVKETIILNRVGYLLIAPVLYKAAWNNERLAGLDFPSEE